MKRLLLIVLMLLTCSPVMFAQDSIPELNPGKILNVNQLARYRWYYSLEEAMREPDKVYKLNLEKSKLKTFPEEIFRFPNLHMLDLSNNKIKSIPEDIYKIPYLQYLNLYNNKIKVLPDNFQYLSQLTTLYLGSNKLIGVQAWVGGLGKLRRLDVSYNNITPYELGTIKYQLPKCEVTP